MKVVSKILKTGARQALARPGVPREAFEHRRLPLAVGYGLLTSLVGFVACGPGEPDGTLPGGSERLAQVAAAGSEVMPFDLDATTHIFEKTPSGGVQYVIADGGDTTQVRLIREHLELEATKFARGDFHDPEMIHGPDMPGLHALVMGHERLMVAYQEIEAGAQIRYSTEDADLVNALHEWFDAQLSDHGHHAQSHR